MKILSKRGHQSMQGFTIESGSTVVAGIATIAVTSGEIERILKFKGQTPGSMIDTGSLTRRPAHLPISALLAEVQMLHFANQRLSILDYRQGVIQ